MAYAAQLNVRMDALLKEEGDAVLSRFGMSPSSFIRAAWEYMKETGTVPDFANRAQRKASEKASLTSGIVEEEDPAKEGAGLAIKMAEQYGIHIDTKAIDNLDYDELRELSYEFRLEEGAFG